MSIPILLLVTDGKIPHVLFCMTRLIALLSSGLVLYNVCTIMFRIQTQRHFPGNKRPKLTNIQLYPIYSFRKTFLLSLTNGGGGIVFHLLRYNRVTRIYI